MEVNYKLYISNLCNNDLPELLNFLIPLITIFFFQLLKLFKMLFLYLILYLLNANPIIIFFDFLTKFINFDRILPILRPFISKFQYNHYTFKKEFERK